eukprot:CAMPEP_0195303350 /NCGR_PEP_ID=MMETSP0707-20130614/32605_1 /TAXON_ID=33640 /ORGANISM="Asterionellopsis glacialis, Strain CCMP134" /LENGTH=618 /DNA_ID=CAMNT_0040366859 /DNA_START=531 /DNA_END=2384 /DNA_ORIENTATION=-
MTSYSVKTTIESRFAKTLVTIDFSNGRNCTALHGFTMQLPKNARVTSLDMDLTDGCKLSNTIAPEQDAQKTFDESYNTGRPAAILTASDATQYPVQVSLPPGGKTTVRIAYEELLQLQQHKVSFQVPLSPGLDVDFLSLDLTIDEPSSGVGNFDVDDIPKGEFEKTSSSARLGLQNVLQGDALPRLLHGSYVPEVIPPEGVVIGSEYCLMHLFNPETLVEESGEIPRNIVFVIDVSGSMTGQKLHDAKNAFSSVINTLTSNDVFAIHTFSDSGTEDSWGPAQATQDNKAKATNNFVVKLQTIGSTNLHGAYINGIDRVKNMQDGHGANSVPIVIILTDGQASSGIVDSREIAAAVRDRNSAVNAKIYALAFGIGADLSLLTAISLQNEGKAIPIIEGYGDSAEQIENFYQNELETIALSNIGIEFEGTDIEEQTRSFFSLLPAGTELVTRSMTKVSNPLQEPNLRIITSATSAKGKKIWTLEPGGLEEYSHGECGKSFAHKKITEVLEIREAARSLGDAFLEGLSDSSQVFFKSSNDSGMSLFDKSEAEALRLALHAGLVWPGLTALVTVEGPLCAGLYEDNSVCGTGDDAPSDGFHEYPEDSRYSNAAPSSPAYTPW